MFKVYESHSRVPLLCAAFRHRVISRMPSITMIKVPGNAFAGYADVCWHAAAPLRRVALLWPCISSTYLAREQCTFTRRSMSSENQFATIYYVRRRLVSAHEGGARKERKSFRDSFWRSFLTVMQMTYKIFTNVPEQWNYFVNCYRVKNIQRYEIYYKKIM